MFNVYTLKAAWSTGPLLQTVHAMKPSTARSGVAAISMEFRNLSKEQRCFTIKFLAITVVVSSDAEEIAGVRDSF